jgi:hypothetical protein
MGLFMKVKVLKDCNVAPHGHTTIKLTADQVVDGEIADFLMKVGLGEKAGNEPVTKKTAKKPTAKKKAVAKKKPVAKKK